MTVEWEGGSVANKVMWHTEKFFFVNIFCKLKFYYSVSDEALVILQWATRKMHTRDYMYILDSYITTSKEL